jgi:hypothetical protein
LACRARATIAGKPSPESEGFRRELNPYFLQVQSLVDPEQWVQAHPALQAQAPGAPADPLSPDELQPRPATSPSTRTANIVTRFMRFLPSNEMT